MVVYLNIYYFIFKRFFQTSHGIIVIVVICYYDKKRNVSVLVNVDVFLNKMYPDDRVDSIYRMPVPIDYAHIFNYGKLWEVIVRLLTNILSCNNMLWMTWWCI